MLEAEEREQRLLNADIRRQTERLKRPYGRQRASGVHLESKTPHPMHGASTLGSYSRFHVSPPLPEVADNGRLGSRLEKTEDVVGDKVEQHEFVYDVPSPVFDLDAAIGRLGGTTPIHDTARVARLHSTERKDVSDAFGPSRKRICTPLVAQQIPGKESVETYRQGEP